MPPSSVGPATTDRAYLQHFHGEAPAFDRFGDEGMAHSAFMQAEWLFPELPHDAEDDGATTRHISKWFGHWRRANGLFDPDRMQDFHSLRHSFKDSCREAKLPEDIHDRLTGHAGSSNQQTSRGYGKGGSLKLLSESMNSVDHPMFPMNKVRSYADPENRNDTSDFLSASS